jgi:hypothetical protein
MNLTLSINKELLEQARRAAQARGKSVNQLVREYLEDLTTAQRLDDDLARLRQTSQTGHRGDWTFDREEIHERA